MSGADSSSSWFCWCHQHHACTMRQPGSGHGSGVLLLRNRSHILAIHNLRLSLGLTLTREADLRGPEWNLTRRPLTLTCPLESWLKPWQEGGPLALGVLPPNPHLHLSTLPPITSQHPPTIWKDTRGFRGWGFVLEPFVKDCQGVE